MSRGSYIGGGSVVGWNSAAFALGGNPSRAKSFVKWSKTRPGEPWPVVGALARRQLRTRFGTVKVFHVSKGYGFITPDGGDRDVFVHISQVRQSGLPTLDVGQRVRFNTEIDQRSLKPNATSLRPA